MADSPRISALKTKLAAKKREYDQVTRNRRALLETRPAMSMRATPTETQVHLRQRQLKSEMDAIKLEISRLEMQAEERMRNASRTGISRPDRYAPRTPRVQ